MKLWVIIILFNTPKQQLQNLIEQLKKAKIKDHDICLVNNSKNNVGYATAANQGIKAGLSKGYSFFVVLNPDIKLLNFKLTEIKNGFDRFAVFGGIFKQNKQTYYLAKIDQVYLTGGLLTIKPKQTLYQTDFVSGSMIFISKRAIKTVGWFDQRYFLYYEDVDYCYRAKLSGLKVGVNSKISYQHFEESQNHPKKKQNLANSHRLFLSKYGKWWQKLAFQLKKRDDR